MVAYFRDPFRSNVFIACWTSYRKADEKDLGARVRKRAKTVIIFLTYSIRDCVTSEERKMGYDFGLVFMSRTYERHFNVTFCLDAPAVSHKPKFTGEPPTITCAL